MCRTYQLSDVWNDDIDRYKNIDKYVEDRQFLRPSFCTKDLFRDIKPHVCGTNRFSCWACMSYIHYGIQPGE